MTALVLDIPDHPRVRILDGLASPDLAERLSAMADRNVWKYSWRPNGAGFGYAFWNCDFAGDTDSNMGDCLPELQGRPFVEPILTLWGRLAETIAQGHTLVRVYANGHTYGGGGDIHLDNAPDPSLWTFVYYAHRRWEPNWGGETLIMDDDGVEIAEAVQPRPGRVSWFRGDNPHCARPPSRECPVLRVVYVFKTRR